jgi:D-psicose/D-tagatose/L-ribulose 3-epimerase
MKLSISNIAWDQAEQAAILPILTNAGITGIEIAPTKIWPDWKDATPDDAARSRAELAAEGFSVPALQSILFGKSDLHVFGDSKSRVELIKHVSGVAKLAGALGAKVMVFGSPRNRLRGDLSEAAAMREAVTIFRDIGSVCAAEGTALGIEANPRDYGGDFLLTWRDAVELVGRVDHPGIVLHFDTACTAMAGDDPVAALAHCADLIRHFHVSAAWLSAVGNGVGSSDEQDEKAGAIDHTGLAAVLRARGYSGWVSIEMRRVDTPEPSIQRAVDFVRAHYG